MSNKDKKKLASFIREDKWDQAKKLLDSYLKSDLSLEEKGAAYVAFITTYLDIVSKINEGYEAVLDEVLSELKELEKREAKVEEEIKLSHVNSQIDNLIQND